MSQTEQRIAAIEDRLRFLHDLKARLTADTKEMRRLITELNTLEDQKNSMVAVANQQSFMADTMAHFKL